MYLQMLKGGGSDICLCSTAGSKGEAGQNHGLIVVLKEKRILLWFSSGICDVTHYSIYFTEFSLIIARLSSVLRPLHAPPNIGIKIHFLG